MDVTYRRQPDSRLERLLARLLLRRPAHQAVAVRIDFVLGADIVMDPA